MPNNFSFTVDGADRVMEAFKTLPQRTSNQVKRKLQASADKVLSASQREVAVLSGDLKDSGRVEPVVDNGGDYVAFDVTYGDGNATPATYSYPEGDADGYSWFVELGTVNMDAQPYLGPAFEEESQKLLNSVGNIFEEKL